MNKQTLMELRDQTRVSLKEGEVVEGTLMTFETSSWNAKTKVETILTKTYVGYTKGLVGFIKKGSHFWFDLPLGEKAYISTEDQIEEHLIQTLEG